MNAIIDVKNYQNKIFIFKGKDHFVQSITPVEGEWLLVETPTSSFKVTQDQLLEDFKPVEVVPSVIQEHAIESTNGMNDLVNTMLDTIKRVNENPQYVPQAKAVNEAAKNIIEVRKTQISLLNMIK